MTCDLHARQWNQINDNSRYLFQMEEKRVAAYSDHQRDDKEQRDVHFGSPQSAATCMYFTKVHVYVYHMHKLMHASHASAALAISPHVT